MSAPTGTTPLPNLGPVASSTEPPKRPSGLGGATVASQFVVVAIVACGVFAAVVITIMYRRRRAPHPGVDEWAWGGPSTRLLVDNGRGVMVEVPRRRRRKVGPEPEMWDARILMKGDDEEGEGEEWEAEGGEEKGLRDVEVVAWSPLAVALPPNPDPFDPSVDVTVLIAMPEPPRERQVEDEFDFPPLELATYVQPVSADWAEVKALLPPKPKKVREEREETEPHPHHVRVDGFRRFRRAYA